MSGTDTTTVDFGLPPAELKDVLRTHFNGDGRIRPSWSPDERKVCLTFDVRSRWGRVFESNYNPKVIEIEFSDSGALVLTCAATGFPWGELFGPSPQQVVERLLGDVRKTLRVGDPTA